MNITVYLGSTEGNDPAFWQAVAELGNWIGKSGNSLVYGGSKTGLMGGSCKECAGRRRRCYGCRNAVFCGC